MVNSVLVKTRIFLRLGFKVLNHCIQLGRVRHLSAHSMIYTIFRARRITFFLVNRVENQNEPKRPQSGGRLGSFWFSTRPTAMGGTDYNVLGLWGNLRSCSSIFPIFQLLYNQCLPLPQAELKTKTNPNGHHFCGRLGSFWFSTRFTRKKVIRLARKTVYIGVVSHGALP